MGNSFRAELSPCYGCSDRKIGCHGGCEYYRKYKEYKDEERKMRNRMAAGNPDNMGLLISHIGNRRVKTGGNK